MPKRSSMSTGAASSSVASPRAAVLRARIRPTRYSANTCGCKWRNAASAGRLQGRPHLDSMQAMCGIDTPVAGVVLEDASIVGREHGSAEFTVELRPRVRDRGAARRDLARIDRPVRRSPTWRPPSMRSPGDRDRRRSSCRLQPRSKRLVAYRRQFVERRHRARRFARRWPDLEMSSSGVVSIDGKRHRPRSWSRRSRPPVPFGGRGWRPISPQRERACAPANRHDRASGDDEVSRSLVGIPLGSGRPRRGRSFGPRVMIRTAMRLVSPGAAARIPGHCR